MANPTYDAMIHPLLRVLAAHPEGIKSKDAHTEVADLLKLSEEDRRALLPSGKQLVYKNRTGWAHDRLKRAGWSESLKRGFWQITPLGQEKLKVHAQGIDPDTLQSLCKVASTSTVPVVNQEEGEPEPVIATSPLERLYEATKELRDSVSAELQALIKATSPEFFEKLVLDVLHAMGYGATSKDLIQTQASADEGIDGVITLDRLGLEKVYIQAKRWTNGTVGRPELQKFCGALAGKSATRGVFITTSTFTKGAYNYVAQVPGSIVLVDGAQLADFMIEYEVGISVQEVFKVTRIDHDYFEED